MSDERRDAKSPLGRAIGRKVARKLEAKRLATGSVWFGLGMMGLVGWSLVVPTLAGTMLGSWLDKRHPGTHSWTLALLFVGLALGCLNAWYWVQREDKKIHTSRDDDDE